jgi:hypothetical protein
LEKYEDIHKNQLSEIENLNEQISQSKINEKHIINEENKINNK